MSSGDFRNPAFGRASFVITLRLAAVFRTVAIRTRKGLENSSTQDLGIIVTLKIISLDPECKETCSTLIFTFLPKHYVRKIYEYRKFPGTPYTREK